MNILVLNASEEVIDVRPISRAMKLIVKGKAHKPSGFDDYHEVSTPDGVMRVPTALKMAYYVKIPYRRIPCTRINILRRDGFECAYCGIKLTGATGTVDHVTPQSKGGKHIWANVVSACKKCNGKKDDKRPEDVGMKLRFAPYVPKHDATVIHAFGKREAWERWIIT